MFALYQDPKDEIGATLRAAQQCDLVDVAQCGSRNMLTRITSPDVIAAVRAAMVSRDLVIADGHHRYETALTYRDERRALLGHSQPLSSDYVMMYLVSLSDPGLFLLPAHRVIAEVSPWRLNCLLDRLKDHFFIERTEGGALVHAIRGQAYAFGLYLGDASYLLRLRATPEQDRLDAALLQDAILQPLLGITKRDLADSHVMIYTIHEQGARDMVQSGKAAAAFILNATRLDQVWTTAMAQETMPQKSTYFAPKPLTGLVINPLDSDHRA